MLDITSYQASGMVFVGSEHCQWWPGSPLGNQNPHLWLGSVVLILVYVIFFLSIIRRKRKRTGSETKDAMAIDGYTGHLASKQKYFINKLAVLEEKMNKGEISPREYAKLHAQYEGMLSEINDKLAEFNYLKGE